MKAMRQKQNISTLITKLKQRFRISRMKSKMKNPILKYVERSINK